MIKLIIADDHKLIRHGLKALLENAQEGFQIVGEVAFGKELLLVTCLPILKWMCY